MSINRVTVSGNLGRDPELRATSSGTQVLGFSICVNDRVKRGDRWEDAPNWLDACMFGQRAESVAKYLSKGAHVTVAGKLRQRTWEAKDGSKRSRVEIVCEDIDFSGAKREERDEGSPAPLHDDDIPF